MVSMNLSKFKAVFGERNAKLAKPLLVALLCGIAGFLTVQSSSAATHAVHQEAENGTVTGDAVVTNSAGASGVTNDVKFVSHDPNEPPDQSVCWPAAL